MGISAYFGITFKEPPTETQLKQLRYNLIHRFTDILEHKTLEKVITPASLWLCEEAQTEDLYSIDTLVRYYGKGYERGPGLEISGLLLYLCRHPDVKQVYYGGDGLRSIDEKYALDLFSHWLENGRLPYLNQTCSKDHPWYKEPPICERCEMPMFNRGGYAGKTFWICFACDNCKEL
jgi:hypothetical protein